MTDWLQTRIMQELGDDYGRRLWADAQDTIAQYQFFEGEGQAWQVSGNLNYRPNQTIVNHTRRLIGKVAGFMFSRPPEITLTPVGDDQGNARRVAELEQHIREVLENNRWPKRLLDAGRDCFVGKRVALKIGVFGGRTMIRFRPSVEFFHDVSLDDNEQLSRIIFAYGCNEQQERSKQRIFVQSFRMEGGKCLLTEGIYNGYGAVIEERYRDEDTKLDALPAHVILNEGMTSDVLGKSDVQELAALGSNYNRMVSDDMDALKFNMFPQTVFTDATEESMEKVEISPGSMIDLQTDSSRPDKQARVDKLESRFNYNDRFENARDSILNDMYALMSCPRVTEEYLKSLGVSGKAMRAMYWDLECRCEERWAEWDPALQWMVREIVHQEKLYGLSDYTACRYTIQITHLYPIVDDEEDERRLDMQEVASQVRSRRSYLEKWQPTVEAEGELQQMAAERQQLEEGWMPETIPRG